MNFFGIGALEILMILLVALIIFGPQKLAGVARNMGKTFDDLRRHTQEARDTLARGLEEEPEETPKRAPPAPRRPRDTNESSVGMEH